MNCNKCNEIIKPGEDYSMDDETRKITHKACLLPSCFGSNPSIQQKAENDCISCVHVANCHDINQHEPGAKLDQEKPQMELILNGFPHALEEVGKVGTFGAKKYSRGGWKTVEDGINRYTSAMIRHQLAKAKGEIIDPETGISHDGAIAWNALAICELELK